MPMKAKYILIAGMAALAVFSCSKRDVAPEPVEPEVEPLPPARIVSTTHDEPYGMTVCVMEYPSSDPYGNPITLSGTITYGDEIKDQKPAKGIMLVNRPSAAGTADCPSGGFLLIQKILVGSGLVCVSPDLYGFGVTVDKSQAYCMGEVNAQAAVDALLAAQELLPGLDIPYEPGKNNRIFNMGYSQGGQTAIAVLKAAAEQYPDLHFAHTFAGSGPYNMPETFISLFRTGETRLPATVIQALLAFNEYYGLGYRQEELFRESAMPDIKEYILSKNYSIFQVNEKFSAQRLENLLNPDILNAESEMFRRFSEAVVKDNLCTGWVPRKEERIFLNCLPQDDVVSSANTLDLYHFLTGEQEMPHVELFYSKGVSVLVPDQVPRHIASASDFAINVMGILASNYDIAWLPNFAQIIKDAMAARTI